MKTALQLRDGQGDGPRCELLWGEPLEALAGPLGPILVFGPGAIVAYVLQSRRRRHLYVFRTLEVDDPLAASVPCVRPRVQLLLDLVSAGRVRLVRGLFAYLTRTCRAPSALPDAFYVRVNAALSGRLPGRKILVALLNASTESVRVGTSGQGQRTDPHVSARPRTSTSATEVWLPAADGDTGRQ
jgi:hypothetical protein